MSTPVTTRRRSPWLAGFAIATSLIAAPVLFAGAAYANYFGPLYADDASHDYYRSSSLSTTQKNAIGATMAMLDNTTDMTDVLRTVLIAGTDINFYAVTDSTGEEANWYAWTVCNTTGDSNECDRWHIVFNNHNPHSNYSALACHEVGHSIGLAHQPGNNSSYSTSARTCLRANPDHTDYSTHDIGHINAQY